MQWHKVLRRFVLYQKNNWLAWRTYNSHFSLDAIFEICDERGFELAFQKKLQLIVRGMDMFRNSRHFFGQIVIIMTLMLFIGHSFMKLQPKMVIFRESFIKW